MPKNRNANFLSFSVRSVRYSVRFDRYWVQGSWLAALVSDMMALYPSSVPFFLYPPAHRGTGAPTHRRAGVPAREAIVIGDRRDRDVAPAITVGAKVLLRSSRRFRALPSFWPFDEAIFSGLHKETGHGSAI